MSYTVTDNLLQLYATEDDDAHDADDNEDINDNNDDEDKMTTTMTTRTTMMPTSGLYCHGQFASTLCR